MSLWVLFTIGVSYTSLLFQEFRVETQGHKTFSFPPQLIALFLLCRVWFLTWPSTPAFSQTGWSSRWTLRLECTTLGTGMAMTAGAMTKPMPRAHLTTHSRPFMWGTSPFPVRSQTCPRTPLSSFLDGPRYVSLRKVFEFEPHTSGF